MKSSIYLDATTRRKRNLWIFELSWHSCGDALSAPAVHWVRARLHFAFTSGSITLVSYEVLYLWNCLLSLCAQLKTNSSHRWSLSDQQLLCFPPAPCTAF